MLLIFGTRFSEEIIDMVAFVCGYCRQQAPQNVIRRRNRFTFFFVPLFSVFNGSPGGEMEHAVRCRQRWTPCRRVGNVAC